MNSIIQGRKLFRIKGRKIDKFRREAPKEDNPSLEPLYRYLPETSSHNNLQKVRGYVVELIAYHWETTIKKNTLNLMGSQWQNCLWKKPWFSCPN
jgi:hypothetical protein